MKLNKSITNQNSTGFSEIPICDHKEVALGLCKHSCFRLSLQQLSTELRIWVSGKGKRMAVSAEASAGSSRASPTRAAGLLLLPADIRTPGS